MGKSYLNETSTPSKSTGGRPAVLNSSSVLPNIIRYVIIREVKGQHMEVNELTAEVLIVSFVEFTIHIARKAYSVLLATFYNPPERGLT